MKRFIRCYCFFLAIVMILATPVFAAETSTPRASYFFASHAAYLNKVSNTQFQICFDVTAVSTMDELGTSVIEVQRSSDGVNWSTIYTYTKESYIQMIALNTVRHASYVTYTGTKGYYYRAYVTFYAENDEGIAKYPDYTETLYLPKT